MDQGITERNMSKQLIESIIDDNLVEAKDIFAERMEEILECKLYEAKRMIQAELNEAKPGGGFTTSEIEARKKAGFRRASEVLGGTETKKSPAAKRLAAQSKGKGDDDLKAKLMQAKGEWKKAPFGERKKAVQMVQKAAKEYAARQPAPKKTAVTPTETPTKAEPQADTTPRQMPKLDKPKPPRDISVLAPKGKGVKALRKADAPRNMGIISRYRSGLEKAKDLQSRGSEGAVKRFKKAYGLKALPAQAASGLSIIKRGLEHIADS